MEEKIREFIESLFAVVPANNQLATLKKDITTRMIDRYYNYVESGKTPGEAFNSIAASAQDVYDAIDNVLKGAGNIKDKFNSARGTYYKNHGRAPFSNINSTGRHSTYSGDRENENEEPPFEKTNNTDIPVTKHKRERSMNKKGGSSKGIAIAFAVVALVLLLRNNVFDIIGDTVSGLMNSIMTGIEWIDTDHSASAENSVPVIPMEENTQESEDNSVYNMDNTYTISENTLNKVKSVKLDWNIGSVSFKRSSGNEMIMRETSDSPIPQEKALYYTVEDGVLKIDGNFKEKYSHSAPTKSLEIELPADFAEFPASYSLNFWNVDCSIDGLTMGNTDIYINDGSLVMNDIVCEDKLTIRSSFADVSASGELSDTELYPTHGDTILKTEAKLSKVFVGGDMGNVSIEGNIHRANIRTGEGNVSFSSSLCPYAVDIRTAEGQVGLTIPEISDFTLKYDTETGKLSSELTLVESQSKYIRGDGIAAFNIETVFGDLIIDKY